MPLRAQLADRAGSDGLLVVVHLVDQLVESDLGVPMARRAERAIDMGSNEQFAVDRQRCTGRYWAVAYSTSQRSRQDSNLRRTV